MSVNTYSKKANETALNAINNLIDIIDEMVFDKEDCVVKMETPIVVENDSIDACPFTYEFNLFKRMDGNILISTVDNQYTFHINDLSFNELYSIITHYCSLYANSTKTITLTAK